MVSTITKRAIVIFVVLCMATFLPILHFNAYIKTLKAISASTDDDDNFIYMNTKKDSVTDTEAIDDDDDDDNDDNDDKEGDEEIPSSSSSSACSTFKNSEEWLNGPRHSNINETLMTDEYIQQLILHNSPSDSYSNNGAKDILSQSVCLPNSTFLNWDYAPKVTSPSSNQPQEVIEALASRLMFLAIHEHQFGPARLEAMARYNKDKICNDDNDHKKYMASLQIADVGRFDYECPDTKYLISNVPRDGFGASLRVGMVDPMFIGLVTNRTVLYVTSLEDSYDVESQFKTPWPLASCPRKDMQCVYMPFSPCVLTKKDIDNGLSLPTENLESARSKGYFGDGYDDAKVLMMTSDSARHKPTPKLLMSKFVSIIQSFYEDASSSGTTGKTLAGWEFDQETLSKVYQFLKDEPAWLPHQITSLYLMRPNMESRKQVENAMQKILPENFDPSKTVGFPIRGTDKCHRESECLPFSDYIQVMRDFITKREKDLASQGRNTTITHIMLSSESKQIINARLDYVNNSTFPYDFIVNEEDAGQGTGNPRQYHGAADRVMISSLISLQMQLSTESIVLNDCSNFHKLMLEQLRYECGYQNYFETYRQNVNPKYRMKCW